MIKRIYSFSLILLFFISPCLFSQGLPDTSLLSYTPLLSESFDNNTNNWITDNLYLSGSIKNGIYTVKCKNYKGLTGISFLPVQIDQSRDYEIEAGIKINKGSGGLVFGMNEKFDHYRVELNSRNDLFFVKDTPLKGKTEKFQISLRTSSNISSAVNKITVTKFRDTYYLSINESFIRDLGNLKFYGNLLGFNTGMDSEIIVDYLKVSYLDKKDIPSTAENKQIPEDLNQTGVKAQNAVTNTNVVLQNEVISDDPAITWTSPSAERVQVTDYTVRVKAEVKSGSKLEKVMFYVNGSGTGENEFQKSKGQDGQDVYNLEKVINLKPGENEVYFLATYADNNTQKSPVRYFVNPYSSPPTLIWISPLENNSTVNNDNILIQGSINSPSGLTSAKIFVNGVPQVEENSIINSPGVDGTIEFKRSIILREGENSVYLVAVNNSGTTQSDKRTIYYDKTASEKRLALVIGNSEYKNGGSLKNPVNDANLIQGTLEDLGFEVIKCLNAGKDSMMNSIRLFSRKMESYNVALFYYAGHGLQVGGVNYLLPTDAKLENEDDCSWEAVPVQKVTDEFKKHETNTNIVILDACRNNPFRSWMRGPDQGFKAMGPINGTIISFAASEGESAADGTGSNGLYTEELVKQMVIPQQIENVFKSTRKNVMERSKNQQIPMEWNYLIGDFFFKK